MTKRKLFLGLASAGVLTTGFGAAVLPASAELRTLTITLLGGKTVNVTVDVPPGTPLDQIQIPGITTPILSIVDAGSAAAAAPTGATGPTGAPAAAPATTGATGPAATPDAPAASTTQADQKTTGTAKRKEKKSSSSSKGSDDSSSSAGDSVSTKKKKSSSFKRKATAVTNADGSPTAVNPTFSFGTVGAAPIGVPNFFIDKFRIPPFLLPIYQAAGIQYGVRWEVLAAINEIETDYGRNLAVSSAGAQGWMQFMPATWKTYGVDGNDDGKKDPYNPVDAIFAAARYLRAAGADKDIKKAIYSYNHASWYVDSVVMRAKLIAGLPSDLVGSLTGLTQGHFPVHATATYADDDVTAKATKRVKGKNAAVPVTSSTTRKGIDVFAKAGSPAIAVQDGKIVNVGESKRLGKFVQLQDAYGNTYTYGGLKKLATAVPVPKSSAKPSKDDTTALDTPAADPKPTTAASAGSQKAEDNAVRKAAKSTSRAKVRSAATGASTTATVTDKAATSKELLFADPSKPANLKAGGEEQMLNSGTDGTTFKSYFTEVYGLKRSDVTIKPLKKGSKVIAGTILGRIGTVSTTTAPHLRFEIRPAGKDAPRIDPKPILDGWKLLESTAVYRAKGTNPFFGSDAKNPSIGQILLLSKEQLQRRVLEDPRVSIYAGGDKDIKAGEIDRRVLATLEFLSASGLKPTVSSLKGNHGLMTTSGNVSEHSSGNAVDISQINGIPILGHQGPGSITDITIRRLLTLQGTMKPHQIISLMTFDGADNTLSLPDHDDHIHVGFRPLYGENSKLSKQLDSVLKPGQWIKLISRLGDIENPNVLTKPSKAAIDVPKSEAKAPSGD